MTSGYVFQPLDAEKIIEILKITSQSLDWKVSVEKVLNFTRQYFIFDNVAIYYGDTPLDHSDVLFARATGRGRSKEADVSWGETIANRVITEKEVIKQEPATTTPEERFTHPYVLGIPLFISKAITGALVFVRFGGPSFEEGCLEYADILADRFTSIVRRKSLDDLDVELEKQKTYTALQGDFINTISHEIRNPLGFIRGYSTSLLREDTNWDEKTKREFLEIIDRETNNLSLLIDDLLDSSRLQSGKMRFDFQPLRLESIIQDEIKRSSITDPRMVFHLDIAKQLPRIHGDHRRIAQVIANLIENSKKYAAGAGIRIKSYEIEDYVILEYTDEGPGIDAQYLPMVFSRFFRVPDTSHTVRGSGLGLSICKQIVENHNGVMEVSSPPNKGLTFTVKLPKEPIGSQAG